mmetsp:Transcript_17395/g.33947  ORF Transcript_17395/g.33947 Transcript_17395/m.33947 type:complete len:125 (-) Transcript_17395:320-694(-)
MLAEARRICTSTTIRLVFLEKFTFLGDFHGSDILMVWDNYKIIHDNKKDQEMSATFQHYWRTHAIHQSPNYPNDTLHTFWPAWSEKNSSGHVKANMVLDVPTSLNTDLLASTCDMWDALPLMSK